MTGKKDALARLMASSGLVGVISAAHDSVRHDLRVLAYHRVLPRLDQDNFDYDVELVSAWEEEFDWQMGHLARHYRVITPRELVRILDAGKPVPRNAAMVTFDDGYRDNHAIALPILRRHGLAATMFVTTGYLDTPDLYWFDELAYCIKTTPEARLQLGPDAALDLAGGRAQRQLACEQALRYLKVMNNELRQATVKRWIQALRVGLPKQRDAMHGSMSWAQVKNLADNGMEIGSHSVTHPVLPSVPDDAQLRRELFDSKQDIEARTGQPVVSIAYPVGGPRSYDERVIRMVRDCGYRLAFTYTAGENHPASWNPFRLCRMAVERYTTRDRFAAMLAAPALFS